MMNRAINLVVFFSMVLTGCSDPLAGYDLDRDSRLDKHAVYNRAHPWIGKCARFESPMVYLTNLPSGAYEDEVIRIGRDLSREVDAFNFINEATITLVPPGTTFEVTAVFMLVHTGFSSFFNSDFEMAVLKDSQGMTSTYNLSGLSLCN